MLTYCNDHHRGLTKKKKKDRRNVPKEIPNEVPANPEKIPNILGLLDAVNWQGDAEEDAFEMEILEIDSGWKQYSKCIAELFKEGPLSLLQFSPSLEEIMRGLMTPVPIYFANQVIEIFY